MITTAASKCGSPAIELVGLLNECARQAACKGRFVSLFRKAEAHQLGWNLCDRCLVSGHQLYFIRPIRMDRLPTGEFGHSFEMPPFPHVLVARIPYASLGTNIMVEAFGRPVPLYDLESQVASTDVTAFKAVIELGRAIGYRDLYLSVGKLSDGDFGGVFFENCSVDLQIKDMGPDAFAYHTTAYDMGDLQGAHFIIPEIRRKGYQRVMIRYDVDIYSDWICRQPGSTNDPLHDALPDHGACVLERAPVDIDHVEDWLFRDKALRHPNGEILAPVFSPFAKRASGAIPMQGCDTAPLAADIEAALHSGAIEAALCAWANRFRALMDGY